MERFPAIPYQGWIPTRETLHRFTQIVGKIRLAASPRRNHWWNVPFHLTGRGITTRPMGGTDDLPIFCIDFDFVDHQLLISSLDGRSTSFPLAGQSVASFYHQVFRTLDNLGISVEIRAVPFGLDDKTPFAEDSAHADYDPAYVTLYWQVLSQVAAVLERHAADFSGKISSVHHFWHSFDIAVTRFTGRDGGVSPEADSVTREAYSREVISAGFWFGDTNSPWPAFYSYTAPEPAELNVEPLRPARAAWMPSGSGHLAVLKYDDVRSSPDPVAAVLDFLDSGYRAGAHLTGMDTKALDSPGGVTDPFLKR